MDLVADLLRKRRRDTSFARKLETSWTSARSRAPWSENAARILERPPKSEARVKGEPDLRGYRARLLERIGAAQGRGAQALEAARSLAAVDMFDDEAFAVYLDVFRRTHADVLDALSRKLGPTVVMHISCKPRVDRAYTSRESFAGLPPDVGHVVVVGGGFDGEPSFDPVTGILTIAADDSYEHLPAKVFTAVALLITLEAVRCVVKVDDDHLLADAALFARYAGEAGRPGRAQVWGQLYQRRFYGDHNRAWHLGKCEDPLLNDRPYGFPGAVRWATGEAGYFMNRAAGRYLHWAGVYFADYIRVGMYEDVLVADLMDRLGGRLRSAPMARILRTTAQY